MNYRHAYHAGNFADVAKHTLLVLLLQALNRKATPWCYFESHAGAGGYDLGSEVARRTGEAEGGIIKLWPDQSKLPTAAAELCRIVAAENPGETTPRLYPGSPAIARALARADDRLVLAELHPEDAHTLKQYFRGDGRVAVHPRDGYEMLKALTPPKEKRGLVLLDPPYEQPDEFDTLAASLIALHERWSAGIYAAWYPLKDEPARRRFLRKLEHSGLRKLLLAELRLPDQVEGLAGSGMLIINPPWQVDGEARENLAALAKVFKAESQVSWLVPE
jgi:23S rRNA (adenine2030-N6)-methyltransferase